MDDMTRLPGQHQTTIFQKKLVARFPEIFSEEIHKFAEKAINKIESKLQTCG